MRSSLLARNVIPMITVTATVAAIAFFSTFLSFVRCGLQGPHHPFTFLVFIRQSYSSLVSFELRFAAFFSRSMTIFLISLNLAGSMPSVAMRLEL